MSRIPRGPSPEADAAREALNAYLRQSGQSLNAMANGLGIQQSTLYRFAHGFTKEIPEKVQPAIDYVHKHAKVMHRIRANPDLLATSAERIKVAILKMSRADPAATEMLVRLVEAMSQVLAGLPGNKGK